MRSLLVLLAACGSGSTTPAPPSNTGGTPPAIPDLASVQAKVGAHANHRLANERGCYAEQTLGEYVAMLVKNGTGEAGSTDTHRLTGGCVEYPAADQLGPIDPPRDSAYWYCRIDSYTSDPAGESPWHYELRLRIKKSDGSVDLSTLSCPGTP